MSIALIVLNFVRKNWLPIAITVAVFSLYIYVQMLRGNIEDLERDIINKDIEIAACKENIDDRNDVIEAWSEKTLAENEQMQNLKEDIKQLTDNANAKIQSILKERTPKTCDETIEYFIDLGKQYE